MRGRWLAAVVLAGGLVLVPGGHGAGAAAPTKPRPDATLTPAASDQAVTQDNIQQTICVSGYTKTVRHVSSRTKTKVFAEYHVSLEEQPVQVRHRPSDRARGRRVERHQEPLARAEEGRPGLASEGSG